MIRRGLLACWVLTLALTGLTAVPCAALAQDDAPADGTEGDGTDTDPDEGLPDGARTIIGSPDPGPEPQGPGDRGGWAQLALLGVLAAAVGFILRRVIRAARAATPTLGPP